MLSKVLPSSILVMVIEGQTICTINVLRSANDRLNLYELLLSHDDSLRLHIVLKIHSTAE